ncbi:hypothetical protein BU15DRAFT_81475 [Melanogaster broomeanus]|nr:hypothetical protein BU15DRAFT_81475 [Melanogaster broomeanus]
MSYAADRTNSSPLMDISEALALSPTLSSNSLTPEERTALRRSHRKAEQLLGVTLTQDVKSHDNQHLSVGRAPLAALRSSRVNGDSIVDAVQSIGIGALMAVVGAKRARSRQFSSITLVGALKDLGVGMGLDRMGRKKRCVDGSCSRRVVIGPLHYRYDTGERSSGSSTAGSEDEDTSPRHSFLDLDPHEEYVKTPTYAEFSHPPTEDDDEATEEREQKEEQFVWDVVNPFAEPQHPAGHQMLQEHFSKLRLGESVGPLDQPTTYEAVSFDPIRDTSSPPSPLRGSRRSSCDLWDSDENLGIQPTDLAYIDYLLALDEAEEEAMARPKHKRATLRFPAEEVGHPWQRSPTSSRWRDDPVTCGCPYDNYDYDLCM